MQGLLYDTFQSPIGRLYVIFQGPDLAGISFEKPELGMSTVPASFIKELNAYFDGTLRNFGLPVVLLSGTEFEKKTWLSLREIPYGETRTYKWLSSRVGNPRASRAVGRALGKNPIPIVLPCHRIIESDGSLGGFSSGVDIKRRLLDLEYYHSRASHIGGVET